MEILFGMICRLLLSMRGRGMRLQQHQDENGEPSATLDLKTMSTDVHRSKEHHTNLSHVLPARGPSTGRETGRGTSASRRG